MCVYLNPWHDTGITHIVLSDIPQSPFLYTINGLYRSQFKQWANISTYVIKSCSRKYMRNFLNCVIFCNSIHLVISADCNFHIDVGSLSFRIMQNSSWKTQVPNNLHQKALILERLMWRLTLSSLIQTHLHNCQFAWQQSLSVVVKPMKEK